MANHLFCHLFMKKVIFIVLTAVFFVSICVGVLHAQDLQNQGSTTVKGWGSYSSHGSVIVDVSFVTYFNHCNTLLVRVDIKNDNMQAYTFGGHVKLYHYDNTDCGEVLRKKPTDDSPVSIKKFTTDIVEVGKSTKLFLYMDIQDNYLWRDYSVYADIDSGLSQKTD